MTCAAKTAISVLYNAVDKGAHFYRCDFQVHTPRDLNWSGTDAVNDVERNSYAEELILACRQKGLGAIAITDHHDFAFFPYIKKAADRELDESGKPIPEESKIVVFPGLELTLTAPNCQALLILDAAFPENLLQSVLTTLAISPASPVHSKHANVQRIPQTVFHDLTDLYEKLNGLDHLRGRFIVFPNVTDNGHGTMLRSGFANFYKSMPCVGGYTDGPVSNFGTGNLSIVSGENREYGFKSIAVFQTSDNRRRDHSDLGRYTTWVKWSEPTAEALRQACLAKESRLSHTDPELPNLWITSMSVSNSKFLGRVEIEFNQQYNAVIGGRGTGKSTILEYLRWGLCDQAVEDIFSDVAAVETKRKKLIDDTLLKFNGEVIVMFSLNGVKHIVKRNSKTPEILFKVGDGAFASTTEKEIRNLFPTQAYSQKQLSSIGVRVEELKRFVELPIEKALDEIRSDIRDTEAKIRTAYGDLIRKKEIEAEVVKYNLEVTSLTSQLSTLRDGLKGLPNTDRDLIRQKTLYDNEEVIIESHGNELTRIRGLVHTLKNDLGAGSGDQGSALPVQNPELVKAIKEKYAAKYQEIRDQVNVLSDLFEATSITDLGSALEKWTALKKNFDVAYGQAKAKASANQQQLQQIQGVEKRVSDIQKLQMTNRNAISALGNPETAYADLRAKWNSLHTRKIDALDGQCQKFSGLSNGAIRANVKGGLDIESLKQRLKVAFAGRSIREQKIEDLCLRVVRAPNVMIAWAQVLDDLEKLALHRAAASAVLPATPELDASGFVQNDKTRLVNGFDSKKWLELSVSELEFNPVFEYCTNKDTSEYITFADASAGQQATALLSVLLNQEGAPLIIDQPEDDVDSKMSRDIVERIWKAKNRRQLIFSSHNANFVVNGDAELVICCDYVRAGDQTGGQIKAMGAIDNPGIKDEITTVTEGGKEAFILRKEKYGF